jgi:hypothetical protein
MMPGKFRLIGLAGLLGLASLGGGCGKSTEPTAGAPAESEIGNQKSEIFRLHWLGKKQLAADTNAAHFLSIWNLPESARLETQTLDKLATAPWRLWAGAVTPLSNAPSALLRPLLDDLVQQETYLEMQATAADGNPETVLAIRLPADRAALWQSNLPVVLRSLSAVVATNVTVTPSNEWTIVSLSPTPHPAPRAPRLLPQVLTRLAEHGTPHEPRGTNYWVEIHGDAQRLDRLFAIGDGTFTNLPQLELRVIGDGQNVRTSGELIFSREITANLPEWTVPTNLIFDPLIAFSAFRGIELLPQFSRDELSGIKNYILSPGFTWANAGYPLQTYGAVATSAATNVIAWVAASVEPVNRRGIFTNYLGTFDVETNFTSITAKGVPFMAAFLKQSLLPEGEFLSGGLIPPSIRTNLPIPDELLVQLHSNAKLIYYDWEITGPRIEAWTYIGQTLRLIFKLAQMPPQSVGYEWLNALLPRLGNSATAATMSAPGRVSFVRNSTIGFTGVELHLLADWLESPQFPKGIHSFESPSRTLMPPRPSTPAK